MEVSDLLPDTIVDECFIQRGEKAHFRVGEDKFTIDISYRICPSHSLDFSFVCGENSSVHNQRHLYNVTIVDIHQMLRMCNPLWL